MRIAVVAGASGLIGKQCMFKLLENARYDKVVCLVRKPMEIKHPKLSQLIVDYGNLDKIEIEGQVADVFCCLGTTMKKAGSKEAFHKVDHIYVLNLARYFSTKGAENFMLVSASGANSQSSIYYSRIKGETETDISSLSYKAIYIFRPSILLGEREEFRLGERLGIAFALILQPLMMGPLKKYRPIYGSKVAEKMIKCALNDSEGTFIFESDEIENG